MRHLAVCAVALASLLSVPLGAARTAALSWGKPGVSIEQYRADAVTCGRAGYYADVSKTEAAQVFKRATSQLETNEADLSSPGNVTGAGADPADAARAAMALANTVARSASIVEGTHADVQIKNVGALMQAKVDDCLKARGYIRFRLTDGQRKHLAHLHLGSPERHAFLYDLATDASVVTAQAI